MAFEGWQDNIRDLVNDIGRACVVRTVTNTGSSFDPTQTNVDTPATAAFFKFKTNEVDGTVVKRTDRKIVFASTVPVTKDSKVVDGSVVYQIVDVLTTQPDSNTYMYIVQGRA